MWDLAVREKDFQAVDSMLVRYRGSVPLSFRLVPARGRGDVGTVNTLLDEARTLESRQLQLAARYTATYLDDIEFGDSLSRLDLAWRTRPANRAQATVQLGWMAIARGRWSDARRHFETAESMEGAGPVVIHQAFAATSPFLNPPREDLDAIRGKLTRWNPGVDASGEPTDPAAALRPHLRYQLLGLIASRVGDPRAVAASRDSLARLAAPAGLEGVVRMMIATMDADQAYRAGDHQRVIRILDGEAPAVPLELLALPRPAHIREYGFEHARVLRGISAAALKNDADAVRWLEHGLSGSPQELMYRAPVSLELARLYERMGDNARALERYERTVRLWRHADQDLQPLVEAARQRAKALSPHP
jgi:tetratricopeptide (TPR) repeat protein